MCFLHSWLSFHHLSNPPSPTPQKGYHLPLNYVNSISLFSFAHQKNRECGKMSMHAENSLYQLHKDVSGSGLPLFFLDEVGYSGNSRFMLGVQVLNRAENKISTMLMNYLAEDG